MRTCKKMKQTIVSVALAAGLGVIAMGAGLVRGPRLISPSRLPVRLKEVPAARQRIVTAYAKLPLVFEPNRGQSNEQVKFLSRAGGHTMFLTATETVLSTDKPDSPVRMKLLAANPAPQVEGLDQLPGQSNYFIGNDPSKWRTHVPNYARVKYRNVYPGVDVVYYGNQRQIEHDFVVAPGADPRQIHFRVSGADSVGLDSQGELVMHAAGGELRQRKPVVYQGEGHTRTEVAGGYTLTAGNQVGFAIGPYDTTKPLVIDPVLVYSTYLGGSGADQGWTPAVDQNGNVYVTGDTTSTNFPATNPLQARPGGGLDAFVTKLNASGSAVVYSTYIGGSGDDSGHGIAVDADGNAYVCGETASTDFPTADALQPAYGGGISDGFVLKLNAAGSALVYSTYLGGAGQDIASDLKLDASASAYVSGQTASTNFPTANPLQPAYGGGNSDNFVAKLNPAGSALVYSTYLGGSGIDAFGAIAVDKAGNVYLAAYTSSTNFPTVNPLQAANGGGNDACVAKLNAAGSALIYSTYLGGSGQDFALIIAVDPSGNAYVAGRTSSTNFPTVNPLQPAYAGGPFDNFVAKLNCDGSALIYSTYLGGSGDQPENIIGIAADAAGNAYVAGYTGSPDFPTANPLQPTYGGGGSDVFAAKINATGSVLVYSTYLGGSGADHPDAIALDASGNVYMSGWTNSPDFPTVNPMQPAFGGVRDAFVLKLSPDDRSTAVTTVSAASFSTSAVASESIVSAFGSGLTGNVASTTVKV